MTIVKEEGANGILELVDILESGTKTIDNSAFDDSAVWRSKIKLGKQYAQDDLHVRGF